MHLVGYYQVPGTRYYQVPGTRYYQVLPGTTRYQVLPGTRYQVLPGTRYYQVPGTIRYQVLPGTARYYLVGVNVEFLPLAVRLLFVGGTNTIPPDVMIVSIIMIAVILKMNNDGLSSGTSLSF